MTRLSDFSKSDFKSLLLFSCLGFVSGLPFALVTTTFQAWLSVTDVSITVLALYGLASVPYGLKPLWAVAIDWLRSRCMIGFDKVYLLAVLLLATTLLMVAAFPNPVSTIVVFSVFAACFFSATVDICVDAMRIMLVDEKLQGVVTSWFVIFYRIAFILSGAVGLVFANHVGWSALYASMGLLMALVGLVGFVMLQLTFPASIASGVDQVYSSNNSTFFNDITHWMKGSYKQVFSVLLFIMLYKFHGVFLGSLFQVYLIRELGVSLDFIGLTYKTFGMLATFLGGILGGLMSRYFTTVTNVKLTILLQLVATMILVLMILDYLTASSFLIVLSIYMESLCLGISTTFVTVMITRHCDKSLPATQYAFFTSLIQWERTLVLPLSAFIQDYYGWLGFFVTSLAMFPVMWVLVSMKIGRDQKPVLSAVC